MPEHTQLKGGEYAVIEAIGRGGFGVTYRASRYGEQVAIKEFFPESLAYRPEGQLELQARQEFADSFLRGKDRFCREAQILQRLKHQHIVACLDLFAEHNSVYLVMPLLKGQSLAALLDNLGQLDIETTRTIALALVSALHTAHQANIFHLDIKPDNIWIEDSGNVLLLDFGAARQGASRNSTQAFTLDYAPPEILSNQTEVGPFSDIFEMGMLVYQLLTGIKAPAVTERLTQMQLNLPELNAPWKSMLEGALHLSPLQRPQNIQDWWRQSEQKQPERRRQSTRLQREHYQNDFDMTFVKLSPGRFYMGSAATEPGHQRDEIMHRVELLSDFWIQTTPVTCRQWQRLMGSLPVGINGDPNLPISQVSWQDVQYFIDRLNSLGLVKYSLPTEAQWEYACRAGARRTFCFGNRAEELQNYAWYQQNAIHIQPVAQLETNIWGLYDMHGNVCEWCADDYASYGNRPRQNPAVQGGTAKVYRGGSYLHEADDCRSAKRFQANLDFKSPWLGFRLITSSLAGNT